ncbi:MAG: tRNA pseudouridine(38-40) synthase TruA [Actinomycetes bacterium]
MKQPVDPEVDGLFRYRLDLAYDGTDFNGWAKQPHLPSVHGELVQALTTIFGESKTDFDMRVAGRTDAGVHADHQVVHIDLTPIQLRRIGRSLELADRLNTLLPRSIRVHSMQPAAPGFHARFSATSRRYRYRIADRPTTKNPMQARYQLWLRYGLDAEKMHKAAQQLVGLHDFVAYCKPRAGSTTIRQVFEITVSRNSKDADILEIEFEAEAFCHNMVRAITGALIKVGVGDIEPERLVELLNAKERASELKVVQPQGLTLIRVNYPPDSELAAQAEKTMNMRTLDEKEGLTE